MGARAGSSILRHAAVAGLAGAILTVALAWTGWGREAGLSALAGSLVVLVVLLLGLLGISVVVAGDTGLSMAGAAVVYIGQIILIVAALLVLRDRDWLDGRAFAIAAVVQVLVMQVAQVVGYNRGRHAVDAPLAREGDRS
jgi:hypothetical protein